MVNAVISEFNPFHNGHRYLLQKAREKTGADYTVCFMSGDFVQRGDIAFADKHTRAAAACRHGADVVFQLPTAHVIAGASVFGGAGVFCADALGVNTSLCFGSETEDISPLFSLAKVDRTMLAVHLKEGVKSGKSFARAMMDAYTACGAEGVALLKSPNNLLAFEYIKAAVETNADIDIVNILRAGTDHDSAFTSGEFASASFIRSNGGDNSIYMPEPITSAVDRERFEALLLYSVLCKSPSELAQFADMNEGLENKFAEAARQAKTADELYEKVKSKRYTHAKIRRAALSVLLKNPKGLYKKQVPYLKVLSFNDRGRELLKTLGKTCKIPIVTKASDGEKISPEHFALECRASDIYDLCRHKNGGREYTLSPIYVI